MTWSHGRGLFPAVERVSAGPLPGWAGRVKTSLHKPGSGTKVSRRARRATEDRTEGGAAGGPPGPSQPLPHLHLQGEPGPPGQMGPEGPGGQQGSPGTQGRTVQGPVVGAASPPPPPCCPSPILWDRLAAESLSSPGSARGQRRERGPWAPGLAGSGIREGVDWGHGSPLLQTLASAWPAVSVPF